MEVVLGAGAMATGMYLNNRKKKKEQAKAHMYPGMTMVPHKLTAGGQAKIYRGRRKGQDVAVKIFQDKEDGMAELRIELEALYRMAPHPNVVSVVTYYEKPKPALVTAFVEGKNLMEYYLAREKKMSIRRATELALGLACGLKHMHSYGLVHRDIKSNNIMIDAKDGQPVILDFGLTSARPEAEDAPFPRSGSGTGPANGASVTATLAVNPVETDAVLGTPCWLAPEMIKDSLWDERSDVYSFGVVLWELFSCEMPFSDPPIGGVKDILKHIAKGGRPNLKAIRDTPLPLRELVEACWHQDLRKRPSMRRVVEILEHLLRTL